MDYETLLPYADTEVQRRCLAAVIEHGSHTKAAAALGFTRQNVDGVIMRIRQRGELHGYAPGYQINRPVPPMLKMSGLSDMRTNEEGKPIWYKYTADREQITEILKGFAEGLSKDIEPRKPKPVPEFQRHDPDMLTGVFIGDAHIGMRAFGKETKHSNFDTDIATEQLRDAIDYLVEKAVPTETGLLVNVGDFLHANTQHNTTFSGTPLDTDTRHYMVMEAAAEVMAYMVDRMLDKHAKVILVCARGNHDTDAAGMLALMMKFYYRQEPRVSVLDSHGFYHYIEYGKWLLGIHHGDKQKMEALAGSMARDMAQAWGRTTHRLWCLGHYHKDAVRTLPGVKCKIFAALPPPDSWHASHGYAGDGEMEMLTFRRDGGLHSSHVYNLPQPHLEPDASI